MEIRMTPEQEAQLAQLAAHLQTDPQKLVMDAALRLIHEDSRFRDAVRKGVEQAIDLSARTGVPLVVVENGKIKRIKPKYKYIRVPIQQKSRKSSN